MLLLFVLCLCVSRYSKLRLYWFNSWSKELQRVCTARLNDVLQTVPSKQLVVSLVLALMDLKANAADLPATALQYLRESLQEGQATSDSNSSPDQKDKIDKWLGAAQ